MSFDVLGEINWLAAIVGAIAYFILGAIWYAPPVFGKPWMEAAGMTMEQTQDGPPPSIYIGPFVGSILASIAAAMLAVSTASDTASEGLVLGIVLAVGFAVTLIGTTAVFEANKPKPAVWGAITIGYHAVGIIIASMIVSIWD